MIFAANLKCNHTRASFKIYAKILNKTMGVKCDDIIVFPPSIAFLENENNFIQGAQNFILVLMVLLQASLEKNIWTNLGLNVS